MATNKTSSRKLTGIAARILAGKRYSDEEVKALAGSILAQAADKKR